MLTINQPILVPQMRLKRALFAEQESHATVCHAISGFAAVRAVEVGLGELVMAA